MPVTLAQLVASPSPTPTPLDETICTPQELSLPATSLHCLTRGESVGLSFVFISGLLSLLAVVYVFTRIVINYIRNARRPAPKFLINVPMDVFMLSLFAANFVAAVATVLNGKWLHDGKVQSGFHCSAQGFLLAMGATALALNTTLIALHTFVTLFWLRVMHSLLIPRLAVIFVWVLTIAIVLAMSEAHRITAPPFYAPSPYWCFIRSPFIGFQLAGEYLWLWIALIVALFTYIPLFFWLRGYFDEPRQRVARVMLVYPLVFSILIIPLSVVRWIRFAHHPSHGPLHLPPAATLTVDAIFHLCGVVDVVVFFQTRRGLLLFGTECTCQRTPTTISILTTQGSSANPSGIHAEPPIAELQ